MQTDSKVSKRTPAIPMSFCMTECLKAMRKHPHEHPPRVTTQFVTWSLCPQVFVCCQTEAKSLDVHAAWGESDLLRVGKHLTDLFQDLAEHAPVTDPHSVEWV